MLDDGLAHHLRSLNPKPYDEYILPSLTFYREMERSIVGRRADVLEYTRQLVHPAEDSRRRIVYFSMSRPMSAALAAGGSTMLRVCWPSRQFVNDVVSRTFAVGLTAAMISLLLPRMARSDTIMLRGGGQVEGKVVPDPKDKDRVQVWLLKGRKPLSFRKGQILEVVSKADRSRRVFREEKKVRRDASGAIRTGHLVRAEQADRPGQAPFRGGAGDRQVVRAGP